MRKQSWVRKLSGLSLLLLTSPALAQTEVGAKAPEAPTPAVAVESAQPSTAASAQGVAAEPAAANQGVSAPRPAVSPSPVHVPESTPAPAPPQRAPVGLAPLESGPAAMKGKWNPTFYGFVAVDLVHDSTQSLATGSPGYLLIARPGTYAAKHGRTVFDARGTRFGFRLAAPETDGMKATGVIEADFLGSQLPVNYGTSPTGISEGTYYGSGLLRIRHAALKIESPYVDILMGQYWQLYGWMPLYLPVSVQVPGLPGAPFGRNLQFRVSHTFKTAPVSVEVALAAVRPPARNAEYPDAQGGARLMVNRWRGVSAAGGTGAAFVEMPAGLGVSAVYRRLKVPEFAAAPSKQKSVDGRGLSVDVFLPVIPSHLNHKGNALNVSGSFSVGQAIGDLYSPGVPGGAGFPALPNPSGTAPAPTWPQDIDNGLVTYDLAGGIHAIKWRTGLAGIQYYLPPSGRVWVAANYGFAKSTNLADFDLAPEKIVTKYTLWDGLVYVNVVGPITIAAEFAREKQTYGDGKVAKNNRLMMSGYYSFW